MYDAAFSVVLRRLPAEAVHRVSFWLIRVAAAVPGLPWLLRRWLAPRDPVLRVRALGLDLPGPLGLAAGFDKDALGPDALGLLGFAFVEVGTVTAQAQPGNPRPRVFRLPADRAIINRMGFGNHGAAAAAAALRARQGRPLAVGANIGKSRSVPVAGAVADYVESARLLAGTADYLVVNVSSPNTPGLRDLQAVSQLRPLLTAVQAEVAVPLLVKISPDLADDDIDAVADLALELGLAGIVATNTTTGREHLASDPAQVTAAGAGGLATPDPRWPGPPRSAGGPGLRRAGDRIGRCPALVPQCSLLQRAGCSARCGSFQPGRGKWQVYPFGYFSR
jgi:dihydroorotate dehydrogenase